MQARKHRKTIREALLSDRESYWQSIASEMEKANAAGDTKKLYDLIRNSSLAHRRVSRTIKDQNGNDITAQNKVLERWANHFSALLNRPPPTGEDNLSLCSKISVGPGFACRDEDSPTITEIVMAIKRMKNGKSPGRDEVRPEMLKAAPQQVANMLQPIYNQIWRSEEIPAAWNTSVLLPFHKKGGRRECKNYRGISLLSLASKVLESIILNRVAPFKDTQFRENQAGFRAGRGCVDQIFSLRQILQLQHEYRKPAVVCFIDFKAAFNSVNRERL